MLKGRIRKSPCLSNSSHGASISRELSLLSNLFDHHQQYASGLLLSIFQRLLLFFLVKAWWAFCKLYTFIIKQTGEIKPQNATALAITSDDWNMLAHRTIPHKSKIHRRLGVSLLAENNDIYKTVLWQCKKRWLAVRCKANTTEKTVEQNSPNAQSRNSTPRNAQLPLLLSGRKYV